MPQWTGKVMTFEVKQTSSNALTSLFISNITQNKLLTLRPLASLSVEMGKPLLL